MWTQTGGKDHIIGRQDYFPLQDRIIDIYFEPFTILGYLGFIINFIPYKQNAEIPGLDATALEGSIDRLEEELAPLKHSKDALRLLDRARRKLSRFDPQQRSREELHIFIDQFQAILIDLNATIDETWFLTDQA